MIQYILFIFIYLQFSLFFFLLFIKIKAPFVWWKAVFFFFEKWIPGK